MGGFAMSFTYDDPLAVFKSGGQITGTIHLEVEKVIHVKAIKVKVFGSGIVVPRDNGGKPHQALSPPDDTINHEQYLQQKSTLYENMIVLQGSNNIPFKVSLPANIPDSFCCCYGSVSYDCRIFLNCTEKVSRLSSKVSKTLPFRVRSAFDINQCPGAERSATLEGSQPVRIPCFCISFGSIKASINTDRRAYLTGEKVFVTAEIFNRTTSKITYLRASLMQTIICKSSIGPSLTVTNEIAEVHCSNSFGPRSHSVWSNAVLNIPEHTPSTNLGLGCKIFEVNYKVAISVGKEDGCCAPRALFEIPIVIGCFRSLTPIALPEEDTNSVSVTIRL